MVAAMRGDVRMTSCIAQFPPRAASTTRNALDEILCEISSVVFSVLPRSSQRARGVEYVRGLLSIRGRKTVRKIASLVGNSAAEQRLHHFISSSTWDWTLVRRELARYLHRVLAPRAWVVHPLVIPKVGQHSVGVDRHFVADLGKMVNAQQALGVWSATESRSFPINWRLRLPPTWSDDEERRRKAAIPRGLGTETVTESTVAACLDMVREWKLPVRPVVMDGRGEDAGLLLRSLGAAGLPVLVRISGTMALRVWEPALAGYGSTVASAHRIAGAAQAKARTTTWLDPVPPAGQMTRAVTTRVALPDSVPNRRDGRRGAPSGSGLLLVGAAGGPHRSEELWLTNMTTGSAPGLLNLRSLISHVEHDLEEVSDSVGLLDYAGRSFQGWHRHITLASVAHAVVGLDQPTAMPANP
jgi:hypothetical protein